ncbi:MAG: helix-hairpin-helix domain-containing protein [Campylobacterales bacterium]
MRRFVVLFLLVVGTLWGAVNINTASVDELMTIKGIGRKKAEAIIAYRTKNRGFRSKEELMVVRGIGPKLFKKIKDQIELEGP